MDAQALVIPGAGGGVAPEQIRDAAAAQQGGVLERLDVLPHGCQGLLGGPASQGHRRWWLVAGYVDPAGPGEGEVASGAAQLFGGVGLGGIWPLPGERGSWVQQGLEGPSRGQRRPEKVA